MANQPRFVAEFLSYHPTDRGNPSYQRNNPLNLAGAQPRPREYGTLYGDTRVQGFVDGIQINPEPRQSIIGGQRHDGERMRRHLEELNNPRMSSTAAMGASEQDLGREGERRRRRQSGQSFSLGGTRLLGGSMGRFAQRGRA